MANSEIMDAPNIEILKIGNLEANINTHGGYLEVLNDGGTELLYSRRDIEEGGETKNRGGVYVCAPYFGPAPAEIGPQHGYSRSVDWNVIKNDQTHIELTYFADDGVFAGLSCKLEYSILSESAINSLEAKITIRNTSVNNLPVAPAFHPYFALPQPPLANIEFNNQQKTFDASHGFTEAELVETSGADIAFKTGLHQVAIKTDNMPKTVVWSGSKDKYVCVEPTHAGFVFGEGLPQDESLALKPGEERQFSMVISWSPLYS